MENPLSHNPYAAPLTDITEADQAAADKGRRLVLAVVGSVLAFSVLPGVFSAAVGSAEFSGLTVVRIVVNVALCVFLYRRANWARVVGGSVFCVLGIGLLLMGLVSDPIDSASIALIAFGTVYLAAATVLLFVPAVRAYFGPRPNDAGAFAVIGLVLQCALIVGLVHSAFLVVGALQRVTASGSSDPQMMAEALGQVLIPLILWGALGVLGLLTTAATLMFSRYRARWLFICSWVFAVLYLLFVPVGTLVSVVLITLLIVKRREFRDEKTVSAGVA